MLLQAEIETAKPTFIMSVIGGFALAQKNGEIVSISNRKASAVLAYLALKPTRTETRERLAGLLWSERGEEQARASLRQCLKQLRAVFDSIGVPGMITDRQSVSLVSSEWSTDLELMTDGLAAGNVLNALLSEDSAPDKILYGFESLDQSFSSWLHVVRQKHNDTILEGLQTCLHANGRDVKKAAEALIVLDSTHEEAHRYLIGHYASTGNMAAALHQYNELWELLDNEYDAEPSAETQALIVDIKSGTFKAGFTTFVSRASPPFDKQLGVPKTVLEKQGDTSIPIVGIGQFVSHEGTSDDLIIAANFRREIIAAMARFREWVIVDSKPQDRNADYVLDGSSFRSEKSIGFILTLMDSISGRYIWSEKLELSGEVWVEAQQKLIHRIAVSVNIYLSSERLTNKTAGMQNKYSRYDQWLRGQSEMLYWNPMNEAKAEMTLRKIIEESPNFAPAYGCLAAVYNTRHLKNPGVYRSHEFTSEALRLAKISVELDPLDSRNQLALAWSHAMNERFDQAEIFFGLAYELNPNSPTTMVPCAQGLSYCGDRTRAREIAENAVKLNPSMAQFQWGYVGCIRYLDSDFLSAVDAFDQAGGVILDLLAWKAAAQAMAGKLDQAKISAETFCSSVRESWQGEKTAEPETIMDWLIHCFPIRHHTDKEFLKKGLQRAGL